MTKKMKFYTTTEAAHIIGITPWSAMSARKAGRLTSSGKIGNVYIITDEDIELYRKKYKNPDPTLREIAEIYGKPLTTVQWWFSRRLKAKSTGFDYSRGGAKTYSPETVKKIAKILGWEPVKPQTQKD